MIRLIILFTLTGCGQSLHLIYIDKDTKVIDAASNMECKRSWSTFDGSTWKDYFPQPCNVYLERPKTDVNSSRHRNKMQ